MVYRIFDINEMTEELASHYFPLMSEGRRVKILGSADKLRAARCFVGDMLARQCLAEFCDAPEFSFSLLVNPDSKSVVSNFDAEICVVTEGSFVACAVSDKPIGISLAQAEAFSFDEAQRLLSDTEMRYLFSFSKYSFSENVSRGSCDERILKEKFALFRTLKTAQFNASGRGIRERRNAAAFLLSDNGACCSNTDYSVILTEFLADKKLAVSVIERCSG